MDQQPAGLIDDQMRAAAIAKARGWIEDLRLGRVATLADIANREDAGERHVRLLAPLAFVSPRIVAVIADSSARADLTVTGLAKALPYSWAEQVETSSVVTFKPEKSSKAPSRRVITGAQIRVARALNWSIAGLAKRTATAIVC
jgi:hypothetical protein